MLPGADVLPPWKGGSPLLSGKRLLLVEDNSSQRLAVAQFASVWGLDLVEAESLAAAAAILAAPQARFDLLLLDRELLDPEVKSAIMGLRVLPGAARAAVLLFSANRFRPGDVQGLGANGYLAKPVRPAPLLELIVRTLSGGSQQEQRIPAASQFATGLAERLPMRVLVADDNAINQKVAVAMLARLGYSADRVATGVEVLKALETKIYDIIFLDVQMPEMDGQEAARRICEIWAAKEAERPRLIAMTASAMHGDRELCLEAGMDDYISKPVHVEQLKAILERWSVPVDRLLRSRRPIDLAGRSEPA